MCSLSAGVHVKHGGLFYMPRGTVSVFNAPVTAVHAFRSLTAVQVKILQKHLFCY